MRANRWFRVQQIGVVERESADDNYVDPGEVVTLVIDQRWEKGLAGIEDYSHLVVVCYLDRVPRRRTSGDLRPAEGNEQLPPVGFFATRAPKRPNPIGICYPRLVSRDGNRLKVTGIDFWNGTPIIDLKGYSLRDELQPGATVPGWLTELWKQHDAPREPAS